MECLSTETLKLDSQSVKHVASLPGGRLLINSMFSRAYVYHLGEYKTLVGEFKKVLSDFRIVTSLSNGNLIIYSPEAEDSTVIQGHTNHIKVVEELPDGRIVSGSYDETVRIWKDQDNCDVVKAPWASDISSIAGMADGSIACVLVSDIMVLPPHGQPYRLAHTNFINCITTLPDGCLVSASVDKTIRVWKKNNVIVHDGTEVESLAVLHDGKLACGYSNGLITVGHPGNNPIVLNGHKGSVKYLLVYDSMLISASSDKDIRIWDPKRGCCKFVLKGHTNEVTCLARLSRNKLASGSLDMTVKVWDIPSDSSTNDKLWNAIKNASSHLLPQNLSLYNATLNLWERSILSEPG